MKNTTYTTLVFLLLASGLVGCQVTPTGGSFSVRSGSAQDRQRLLILAIWTIALGSMIFRGLGLPSSEFVETWPSGLPLGPIVGFGLLAPPLLWLLNHLFKREDPILTRIKGAIDRRLGVGTASTFWRRLKPLSLLGLVNTLSGLCGFASGAITGASEGVLHGSSFLLSAGMGFFVAAGLEDRFGIPQSQK